MPVSIFFHRTCDSNEIDEDRREISTLPAPLPRQRDEHDNESASIWHNRKRHANEMDKRRFQCI
jgi:hypothetical protein